MGTLVKGEVQGSFINDVVTKSAILLAPLIQGVRSVYRKVASSNMSCIEAHAGFFRLLMKRIFNPYVL